MIQESVFGNRDTNHIQEFWGIVKLPACFQFTLERGALCEQRWAMDQLGVVGVIVSMAVTGVSDIGAEMYRFCFYHGCLDVKTMTWTVYFQCSYRWAKEQKDVKSKPTFKAGGDWEAPCIWSFIHLSVQWLCIVPTHCARDPKQRACILDSSAWT